MIREDEVKQSFRIAYDTLGKLGEPEFTPEYAKSVTDLCQETWVENGYNMLLKYLLIAIVEWVSDLAREADRK